MNALSSNLFRAAAVAFALPLLGMSAALKVNGTCDSGNCAAPNTLSFGTSETGSTSNTLSVNGDSFLVTSTYDAGYNAARGPYVDFFPTVTYTGSAPSSSADTITIDLLTSYFDNSPGSWDGPFREFGPLTVGANSTGSVDLYVGVNGTLTGVGLVGPFGPGSYSYNQTANLTGLVSNTLNYDYQFIFTFAPNTQPGTIDSSATPEPAQVIPAGLSLIAFGLVALRRRKQ